MKILSVLLLLQTHLATAGTGDLYGFGSHAASMGNTILSGSKTAFATYYNPSANSLHEGASLDIAFGYAHADFKPIDGVVVNNSATSASTSEISGSVDTSGYLDHLGQSIAFSYNFGEDVRNLSFGLIGYLPIARLAYFDTGEPFLPEYYNYRAKTQRPQIFSALSFSPLDRVHFAVGVGISSNVASSVNYTVSSSDNTVSYGRMSATLKPSASPYASLFYRAPKFDAGLTFRMPEKYTLDAEVNSYARVLGPANGFPIVFNTTSMMYYEPMETDLGLAWDVNPTLWMTVELDWLNYSQYTAPALTVTDRGSAVTLQNSASQQPTFRDIFVPKIGFECALSEPLRFRFGYFWRRSPIKDLSGNGNLVDPEKHVGTMGLGWDLKKAELTQKSITLDAYAQYHYLVQEKVVKSPGNEAGNASQSKVGSPGYSTGGRVYGGGLSLSMLF